MNRPAAPSVSHLEGLLVTFMAHRRRLLCAPAVILAGFAVAAALVPVRYAVDAQVLVALGPEYTYRPPAGAPPSVSQGMDRDQTMHTEASILASPDLHRATLRAVGVGRLYPRIVDPGLPERMMAAVGDGVAGAARWAGLVEDKPRPPRDPVELALKSFETALGSDIPKIGSVITETFRHKDSALGAETLNTMLALYIDRRAELYRDDQSAIVARQVEVTGEAWAAAEARLAQFRLRHGVSSFDAQRDIVLRRQGELQKDHADARSEVAQLRTRLDDLARQAGQVAREVASGSETDYETRLAPARASLEQLQTQYSKAREQYQPDAPLLRSLGAQLEARRADLAAARRDQAATSIRTSQNPAWLALQDDVLKSRTRLAVAATRLEQDEAQLADVTATLARLDESEQELGQLRLRRAISEETYRNATKTLEDRRVADAVEARRRPTVRILQPAVPPLTAPPLRLLLLAAGAVLSVLALGAATLLAHAFASTYWQADLLEQDLGIPVLARLPDLVAATRAPGRAADMRYLF